ncbi:MAG: septum formation initiator family protein [Candidatus Cryptobacteroides sp.]
MGKFLDIWDRKKDGSRKELRSFERTMIIALTVAVVFLFVKKDNVLRWVEAGFTIGRQNREIEMNSRQIEQMEQTLKDLTTNRDSLEKYARERYHFEKAGDDIYLIP